MPVRATEMLTVVRKTVKRCILLWTRQK